MDDRKRIGILSQDSDDRHGLGHIILRLYREHIIWRSAVDVAFIGTLVMLLMTGLPDFHGQNISPVSAVSDHSVSPSANFTPSFNKSADHNSVSSSFPIPSTAETDMNVEWIGDISPEKKKVLETALGLVSINNQKAKALLEENAGKGDANYQTVLAIIYINDAWQNKSDKERDRGIALYKMAAQQGHPTAQEQLSRLYEGGFLGITPDHDEAAKWLVAAVENPLNKIGDAEYRLARRHETGAKPFKRDMENARQYYTASSEKGNILAQAYLGALYYNGAFGKIDNEQGLYWTKKAAENGDGVAQLNLGLYYLRGTITGKPEYGEFIKWAGLSADQGWVIAMMELGNFYRAGRPGFPADSHMAMIYFAKAAAKNNPRAQLLMGEMLKDGKDGEKNDRDAYLYYLFAFKNGNTAAYRNIQELEKKLPTADVESVQKLVESISSEALSGSAQ